MRHGRAAAYIRPLAQHQVPRLPRKSHRRQRDARAYIRPLAGAPSAAPATQKPPAERRTSDPLHSIKCRACHAKATGDQGTPGRRSDPLQSTKCRACHAKATGRAAENKGRQGVHPTPCKAPSAAPATQKPPASGGDQETPGRTSDPLQSTKCRTCHAKASGRAADARAYIRPLAEHQLPRLPRKSHRQSGGDQGTPGRTSNPLQSTKCRACHAKATGRAAETKGRQGVHPTPCRAPSAAPATQKPPETKGRQGVHRTPCRAPSAAPATQQPPAERRRPRDARAYIRPLAEQVPRLPRKSHRQSGRDQGTPGRTSDPLQSTKCIYLSIYLSLYLSIYLSIKPARATAKLKLNGVSQVSQTCQADVNMQPAGQKCQLKKGRATNGVSHVYQTCQADVKTCHLRAKNAHLKKHTRETSAIYHVCQTCQGDGKAETEWIETSLSNLPGRRERAACRPKMPGKTWQGDEWRKPCLSNMPGRRLSIYLSSCLSSYLSIYLAIYLSLSIYLSICLSVYLSIYLSVYTSEYLFISPSINLSINQPIYLPIYLCIYLSIYPSIHPSIHRSLSVRVRLRVCVCACVCVSE